MADLDRTSVVFVDPVESATDLPIQSVTEFPTIPISDVMATDVPMASAFNFQVASTGRMKRSGKYLLNRAIWCEEYGRPCRLVVYDDDVIADACAEYLGTDGGSYEEAIVTVTETEHGPTVTETVSPSTCEGEDHYPMHTETHAYPTSKESYAGYEVYTTTAEYHDGYPVPSDAPHSHDGYPIPSDAPHSHDGYPVPSDAPYSHDTTEYPHEVPVPHVCGPEKIVYTVTAYVTVEDSEYTELPSAPHYVESSVAYVYTTDYYNAETTSAAYYAESSPAPHYEEDSTTESYEEAYATPTHAPYYGEEASSEAPYYGEESTTDSYKDSYAEPTQTPYYGEEASSEAPYYGEESTTDVYAEPTDAPYATPTDEEIPYVSPTDSPHDEPAPAEDVPEDNDTGLPTTMENPFAPEGDSADGSTDWVTPASMDLSE
jgi:hypothetical protein